MLRRHASNRADMLLSAKAQKENVSILPRIRRAFFKCLAIAIALPSWVGVPLLGQQSLSITAQQATLQDAPSQGQTSTQSVPVPSPHDTSAPLSGTASE